MESSLRTLGLGEQEARCLGAVYRLGEATATDIATEANASHGTIYDILAKLERRGLIRTVPGVTKHFAPTGIEALRSLLDEKQKQLLAVHADLETMKRKYATRTKPLVTVAEGKANFSRVIDELTPGSKRDYAVRPVFDTAARWREGTLHARKRGADALSFAGPRANPDAILEFQKANLPVMRIPTDNVVLLINDEEVVIASINRNSTMLIRDKDIADTLGWLYKQAWERVADGVSTSIPRNSTEG